MASGSILERNPGTGDRAVISSSTVGTGPGPSTIGELGLFSNGTIVGANYNDNAILLIDPTTGNRTVLSDATHGTGPTLFQPLSVTVVPNVPEPSSVILAGFGGLATACVPTTPRTRSVS